MLIFPLLGELYHLVDHPTKHVFSLVTELDRLTPFIKYFAVPYGVWIFYIYVCLVYFFFRDRQAYYRSILIYTVSALTCYAIYSVFQTTVPRPAVPGNDLFSGLVRFIYNRDEPFNCFPSIHVFSSYMVLRLCVNSRSTGRWSKIIIPTMSVLIILSTLFMKQHVILDAVAGILLVEIYHLVLFKLPGLHSRRLASQSQDVQL